VECVCVCARAHVIVLVMFVMARLQMCSSWVDQST